MSKIMMYKELGGVNWCLCKVIAEYEDKIWLHNIHTGSMPLKNKASIELKEANEYIVNLKESDK